MFKILHEKFINRLMKNILNNAVIFRYEIQIGITKKNNPSPGENRKFEKNKQNCSLVHRD